MDVKIKKPDGSVVEIKLACNIMEMGSGPTPLVVLTHEFGGVFRFARDVAVEISMGEAPHDVVRARMRPVTVHKAAPVHKKISKRVGCLICGRLSKHEVCDDCASEIPGVR
jgi:hypothetical protein